MATAAEHPLSHCASLLEQASHIWIAYSGGLDSSLLLELVAEIAPAQKLTALHINHGLHQEADSWQEFCQQQCKRIGVSFESVKVHLESDRNIEKSARDLRYQVFAERLGSNELLLTGHHANDQAETVLFRMMRGAGLRGLSGMPGKRALGRGYLIRPLIRLRKSKLLEMATQRSLDWVEDSSNQEVRFSRNFIRQEIIPDLEKHWPAAVEKINQSALALGEAGALLDLYAKELSDKCDPRPEAFGESLDLTSFNMLTGSQRQLVLRYLLAIRGEHPDSRRFDELLTQLEGANAESHIKDSYRHVELGVFQLRLYFLAPLPAIAVAQTFDWSAAYDLEIPGVGLLNAWREVADQGAVQVRFRQGGERAHPAGREHSQSLKKLMQDYALPPWLRERIPLIYINGEIAAVAGLFSCIEGLSPPHLEWRESLLQV